jgi:hypothetical protein
MIVQASNTAYDINTANRFTLAVRLYARLQPSSLISARYRGAIQLHMTPVPASTVSTKRFLVPKTRVSSPRKTVKNYPNPYRRVANGASTGTRTPATPRKCAYLLTPKQAFD